MQEDVQVRVPSKNNFHLTAVARNALPLPVRWLLHNGLIHGHVLDYGCGRCAELNKALFVSSKITSLANWDPHYAPSTILHTGGYDVVLCTYVLCVLPKYKEREILSNIRRYIAPNGVAYVTVRNDEPRGGYGLSSKGTFQRKVELDLFELRRCHQYRIYLLTK